MTTEDVADVLNIFRCFGEAEVIAESMIHPVVGGEWLCSCVCLHVPGSDGRMLRCLAVCHVRRPINLPHRR
ncbi:pyrroline-5-carboxylate reductase [Enterobacter cloacae]|uniref:Pyrroline-5-carboxylate reductase n=1 Tax=Enterobacter cloacae TaxID=550 RepID=A0A377M8L6_ENTCL|nr:pyrroline-5-carboxylate reductase [Enterobacter cloacae]